ncbi:DUF58 domain-containing protein [Chryseosolibacter indicus]|uniref:DUF58 domain-containing protein n=1 Tax=Chryseosolibacter indicus TaxID=2782351 RepID=A0ABS5VNK8_9BACT|nr:DUF58 domain-containing protein [Chryseosolibacter indicus]MBT1702349.1 DUF58 domain-containing protein [Chryseosolibacter indicus]
MDARLKDILKPEVVNTVNGLELIARIIVEGFMSGGNKSQSIGIGQEFSQYRNYEPGDDLRQLDWKMYARSERYFIKQAEIETNITVKFFIDASKSMAHEEDGISKLHFTKVITAGLAYLARKQGDTFGLYTVNDNVTLTTEPRPEHQQFIRFLHHLVELQAEGKWIKQNAEQLFNHHGKELIVFISDLYDEEQDILNFISRLKTVRNEVVVFHLLGKHELNLDYQGSFAFKDLETDTIVKVDTLVQRKQYVQRVQDWIDKLKLAFLDKGIHYHLTSASDPVEEVLRNFLKGRKVLAG